MKQATEIITSDDPNKSPSMPNLSDLPNELVQMICECLQAEIATFVPDLHGDPVRARIALARLCRMSTGFRTLAQPLLYRDITCLPDAGILRFIQTVVEQPTLATHVQSISLMNNGLFEPLPPAPFEGPIRALGAQSPEILVDWWVRALRNFPDPASGSSSEDLTDLERTYTAEDTASGSSSEDLADSEGTYTAVVAMCLAFLPNLRSLEFTWPELNFLFDGLVRAADQLPGLSKLETLVIGHDDTEGDFSFGPDAPLLTLPSLRHIKLVANVTANALDALPFYSIAATRLTLEECSMAPEALLSLLRAFKRLKTLHYEVCSTNVGQYADSHSTPRDVAWALENSSQTESLTSLTILLADNDYPLIGAYGEFGPLQIMSLRTFETLERLEVHSIALIVDESGSSDGSDAGGDPHVDKIYTLLPPSIQTLVIHAVDKDALLPLRELAEVCEADLPHLKVVQICTNDVSSESIPRFKALMPHFQQANIKYSVVPHWSCRNCACSL